MIETQSDILKRIKNKHYLTLFDMMVPKRISTLKLNQNYLVYYKVLSCAKKHRQVFWDTHKEIRHLDKNTIFDFINSDDNPEITFSQIVTKYHGISGGKARFMVYSDTTSQVLVLHTNSHGIHWVALEESIELQLRDYECT